MNKENVLAQAFIENSLTSANANQLLTSSLVVYLAEKGVIDIEDYLKHNEKIQDIIKNDTENNAEYTDDEKSTRLNILKYVFELHRENIAKAPQN